MILELQNLNFHLRSTNLILRSLVRRRNEQFKLFIQFKPNLREAQMNVTSVTLKSYEENRAAQSSKNKPNQTQFNPIQSQSNPIKSQFQKRPKMNVTKALTTDYENIRPHRRAENKPNLSRRSPCLAIASCDGGWRSRIKPNSLYVNSFCFSLFFVHAIIRQEKNVFLFLFSNSKW